MNKQEYTPEAVLELSIQKLVERDPALAAQLRAVVDQGRDTLGISN